MSPDDETLVVRALNHARSVSLPAYVGLRCFAENARHIASSKWVEDFVARRLVTAKRWRFSRFNVTKSVSPDRRDYRTCVVGSPVSLLVEAFILKLLSTSANFQNRNCIYSYRWPKSARAGGNFDLFTKAYAARNAAIRQALEADETLEAVVTDIQSFYPSANQKIVLERFVERVNASDDLAHKTEIVAFVRSLLDASPGGIPVGSNLSHVLGNLALEKVDAELERAYPARYFRYVDDIIVLCDRNETVDALRLIKDVLGAEGFALNDFKTDSAAREAWIPKSRGNETFRETAKRFEDFLLRLEVYLARYPARVGEIRTTFNAEGFNFPITRWAAAASQTRFQTFLFRQLRQRPVLTILKFLASDREDLIANAREMRPLLREELHFASQDIPVAGMARRFRLQRIRYLLNRLIYLYPIEQHVDLIDVARRLPELHETELLLTALHTGDATPLLLLPGRTIAAFVELWREAKSGQPNIRWEVFQPKICIDALATLVLGGVVEPPHSVIRALNPHQRELLKFCSGAPGQPVEKVRDSFVDEARRLQNGRAHDFIASLLDTRFSLRESSGLQLFRLDSTYPAY